MIDLKLKSTFANGNISAGFFITKVRYATKNSRDKLRYFTSLRFLFRLCQFLLFVFTRAIILLLSLTINFMLRRWRKSRIKYLTFTKRVIFYKNTSNETLQKYMFKFFYFKHSNFILKCLEEILLLFFFFRNKILHYTHN